MRMTAVCALLLLLAAAGCGGEGPPVTDATKAPVPTADQLEAAKRQDAEVEAAEGAEFQKIKAKYEKSKKAG